MPILTPTSTTAPVFYPSSDYEVVKYLDLTKYISLLQKRALFFCRLDKLEDKFEGITTKPTREVLHNIFANFKKSELAISDEDVKKRVEEHLEFERNMKGLTCVNCWNKGNKESAALWKIYSNLSNGIMIKSSISKLISAFELTKEEIQLTEMKYLDYENDYMPLGNSNYPLIHKHEAYSYEEELRLMLKKIPETGWIYDWTVEEVQEGVYISCDPSILIDEIIISPYSQSWFFELIKSVSDKYDLVKPISKSQLS